MRTKLFGFAAAILLLSAAPAQTEEPSEAPAETLAEAIMNGEATLDLRYRLETVEQDGFNRDATASTLRTRLKYTTSEYKGFSAVLEFDNVSQIGIGDYNSTVNGKAAYPVIADPLITEVNQIYLAYTGIENTTLLAGRTALNLNNQRFVGTVGWRQNDQTWDMVGAITSPIEDLKLTYGYVWNVNRIFGNDHPFGDLETNTHILNAEYTGFGLGKLTAYGLMIDLNDMPVFGLSSQTFGLRFEGQQEVGDHGMKLLYEAEVATQSDYKDNPNSYTANYYHLSGGVSAHGFTGKLGYEVLGSDNGSAFQTPLATLHKFNGWADKFLNTPAGGLEDMYGSISYKVAADGPLKGLKLDAIYHDFSAETGGNYGSEIDLQVSKTFKQRYALGLKFSDYNSGGFATDTQKLWFTFGVKY